MLHRCCPFNIIVRRKFNDPHKLWWICCEPGTCRINPVQGELSFNYCRQFVVRRYTFLHADGCNRYRELFTGTDWHIVVHQKRRRLLRAATTMRHWGRLVCQAHVVTVRALSALKVPEEMWHDLYTWECGDTRLSDSRVFISWCRALPTRGSFQIVVST